MSLVCTSVSGVAEGHFVVGGVYAPDNKGRITTVTETDSGCQALWTVEENKIYALVGDKSSDILVTFS